MVTTVTTRVLAHALSKLLKVPPGEGLDPMNEGHDIRGVMKDVMMSSCHLIPFHWFSHANMHRIWNDFFLVVQIPDTVTSSVGCSEKNM